MDGRRAQRRRLDSAQRRRLDSLQARLDVGQLEDEETAVFVHEGQEVQGKAKFEKQLRPALRSHHLRRVFDLKFDERGEVCVRHLNKFGQSDWLLKKVPAGRV